MPDPHQSPHEFVAFHASHRLAPEGQRLEPVPDGERVAFSLYFAPKSSQACSRAEQKSRRELEHADDFALVRGFAAAHGLRVEGESPARRRVRLSGTAQAVRAALRTELHHYRAPDGRQFRGRSGALHLPADIAKVTEAVLGVDTRPVARPKIVFRDAASTAASYAPNQVGAFYGLPDGVDGGGETIGLIELGGGYLDSDTQAAFAAMGLTPPQVVAVSVDGGANSPSPNDGADGEVALDIQVAGGVAPGAKIAVYFAGNTDAGFVDSVTQAAQDETNAPSVLSISWGSAEAGWTAQAMAAMTSALQDAANLGVSVCVASGDNLAPDGVNDGQAHVDFPASSPWAIGCGGTKVTVQRAAERRGGVERG